MTTLMTNSKGHVDTAELSSALVRAFEAFASDRIDQALALSGDAIAKADQLDVAARPTIAKLHQLRGVIFFQKLKDYSRALAEFTAALDGAPNDPEIRLCLIECCSSPAIWDWERVAELARPLLDAADDKTARLAYQILIQALLLTPCPTTAPYKDHVATWSRRFIEPRRRARRAERRPIEGPMRIGFVHRGFSNRRYDTLLAPLFEELRHAGAYVAAVSTAPSEDTAPPELTHGLDLWLNIDGLGIAEAARRVADAELDILVSLDGFSGATEFELFLQRPASLLVSWHNTHYTFGPGLFDCIIADTTVLSDAERQEYAEDIIDLEPCYFAAVPPAEAPPVAPSPAIAAGAIVFGTMNRPIKIGDETAKSWARILDAVPGSWLFIRNSVLGGYLDDRLRERLAAAGIGQDRLVLAGRADLPEFLESYGLIDIALDTFPFNGGFTTFQALWQGVPVVAFPGERWASRVSASMLRACGIPELVAKDQESYEALAIELAHDVPRLAALRATIRNRVAASPFVDMRRFARQFERKLREQLHRRARA